MLGILISLGIVLNGPTPIPDSVKEGVDLMNLPGLSVTVVVAPCGQINAGYFQQSRALLVCQELIDAVSPAVVRAAVAHEMAHAIIDQFHVPITGSEEVAADELSAVRLSLAGHQTDILQAAVMFEQWSQDPDYHENVMDDHPGNARRAWTLMCLEDGSEEIPNDVGCARTFQRARRNWERLLKLHEIAE
jgi:hypothetical protein